MMVRFDKIFWRQLIVAAAVTALYRIAGWDVREPLAVFFMFAAGLCLQEWAIEKVREVKGNAKKNKAAGRKPVKNAA